MSPENNDNDFHDAEILFFYIILEKQYNFTYQWAKRIKAQHWGDDGSKTSMLLRCLQKNRYIHYVSYGQNRGLYKVIKK